MVMAKPLRVLTCLHSLQAGGVERDVLRFTKAWREHGIDARIALGRWQGELIAEAPDVPYLRLSGERTTARFETWRMIAELPAIIRRFRPDVLLLASNNHAAVGLAMRLLLGRRCPPIVLRVSMDLMRIDLHPIADWIDKWAFRCYSWTFARFVAMAAPVQAQVVAHLAVPPARVVTIPNGSMTTAQLENIAATRDVTARNYAGRVYLGIGRLASQKNFTLLIDAFAAIAKANDRLLIMGEGEERVSLESHVGQLGLSAQVEMPGHSLEIADWLARANVFVLSSDFEGLGNVVVEALAAGLPIVATHCCAAMPMLTQNAGRLVPIRDAAALASAMDSVLDDPIDVDAMRARAAQFTTEATTDRWESLFHALARVHRVDRLDEAATAASMHDPRTLER